MTQEVLGMMRIMKIWLLAVLGLWLMACASSDEKNDINEPGATDVILCEEPRPQVCTREYNPVCGTLKDGSEVTGSTACTSCSNTDVVSYRMGAC